METRVIAISCFPTALAQIGYRRETRISVIASQQLTAMRVRVHAAATPTAAIPQSAQREFSVCSVLFCLPARIFRAILMLRARMLPSIRLPELPYFSNQSLHNFNIFVRFFRRCRACTAPYSSMSTSKYHWCRSLDNTTSSSTCKFCFKNQRGTLCCEKQRQVGAISTGCH